MLLSWWSVWPISNNFGYVLVQARVKTDWQKTRVAADRALAELKAEIYRCLLQGMSPLLHLRSLDICLLSSSTDIVTTVHILDGAISGCYATLTMHMA